MNRLAATLGAAVLLAIGTVCTPALADNWEALAGYRINYGYRAFRFDAMAFRQENLSAVDAASREHLTRILRKKGWDFSEAGRLRYFRSKLGELTFFGTRQSYRVLDGAQLAYFIAAKEINACSPKFAALLSDRDRADVLHAARRDGISVAAARDRQVAREAEIEEIILRRFDKGGKDYLTLDDAVDYAVWKSNQGYRGYRREMAKAMGLAVTQPAGPSSFPLWLDRYFAEGGVGETAGRDAMVAAVRQVFEKFAGNGAKELSGDNLARYLIAADARAVSCATGIDFYEIDYLRELFDSNRDGVIDTGEGGRLRDYRARIMGEWLDMVDSNRNLRVEPDEYRRFESMEKDLHFKPLFTTPERFADSRSLLWGLAPLPRIPEQEATAEVVRLLDRNGNGVLDGAEPEELDDFRAYAQKRFYRDNGIQQDTMRPEHQAAFAAWYSESKRSGTIAGVYREYRSQQHDR